MFEFEISVARILSKDLRYISLKEMKIFKSEVFIKLFLSLSLFLFRLSEAFSTTRWGLGKGLYKILPYELR